MPAALAAIFIFTIVLLPGCTTESHTSFEIAPGGHVLLELGSNLRTVRMQNEGPGVVSAALKDSDTRVHTALTLNPGGSYRLSADSTRRVEFTNLSDARGQVWLDFSGWEGFIYRLDASRAAPPVVDPALLEPPTDQGSG